MAKLRRLAASYTGAARASATLRAYASDWRDFDRWCRDAGRCSLPASEETLCLYLVARLEDRRVSTVDRRFAAIVDKHRREGQPVPSGQLVRDVMRGARREHGTAPVQKAALRAGDLRKICGLLARRHAAGALRDRALLLLGFAAGMRRSEIVALDLADVSFRKKGMLVRIRKGKTDQEGKGRDVGIFAGSRAQSCPVRALKAWLYVRGKRPGALFPGRTSSGHLVGVVVGIVVKKAVKSIGLDPAGYGAHSLRSGFVTAALEAGYATELVMQRTGHRSVQTVAGYFRPATAFSVDALARAL
jgi:integrase